jgi:hypothetical protein
VGEIRVAVPAAAITLAELTRPETWEADGVDQVIVARDLEPGQLVGFDTAIDAVGDELPEWL